MNLPRPSEAADDDPVTRLRAMLSVASDQPRGAVTPTPVQDDQHERDAESTPDDRPRGRAGAWRDLLDARWSLPTAVGVAVLALLAVVAVVLVLRAAVTTPGAPTADAGAGTAVAIPARSTSAPASAPASTLASTLPGAVPAVAGGTEPSGGTGSPSSEVVVDVVGRVQAPGVLRLPAGSRVDDAVRAAGGASSGAQLDLLNLARPLVDGEQVVVPAPGQSPAPAVAVPVTTPSRAGGATGTGAGTGPISPVSLRTATAADLDALPGIGPVLAQRIVDWRSAHGPFARVDDLAQVSGIGPVVLAKIKPLVTL